MAGAYPAGLGGQRREAWERSWELLEGRELSGQRAVVNGAAAERRLSQLNQRPPHLSYHSRFGIRRIASCRIAPQRVVARGQCPRQWFPIQISLQARTCSPWPHFARSAAGPIRGPPPHLPIAHPANHPPPSRATTPHVIMYPRGGDMPNALLHLCLECSSPHNPLSPPPLLGD